jgi:hypothetical protein
VRFSLFWALVQTAMGAALLAALPITFAGCAKERGGDPGETTRIVAAMVLAVFATGAIPISVGYFGLRGLSRRDQIVLGPDGLSGPLVAKGGETVVWAEIADMDYRGNGLLNTLRLRLHDGRRIVIRDLCQLNPASLFEISETIKTRLDTGVFNVPEGVRWWQTAWATALFCLLILTVTIAALNLLAR